jgi:hypothetical protein
MTISVEPWKNVLWNPNERTMIMSPAPTVKLILLYMYGLEIIKASEVSDLKKKYADKISSDDVESALDGIPILDT